MRTRTTVRYYYRLTRMTKIQNTYNTECWRGCGASGTPAHRWWEGKTVPPPWKAVRRGPTELRTLLPHDPAVMLLGLCPQELGTNVHTKTCTWMGVAALLFIYFTCRTQWVTVESFPAIRGLRVEVSSSFGEGALVSVNRSCTSCAFLSKSLQDKGFIRKTSGPNSLLIDTLTFVGEIRQL